MEQHHPPTASARIASIAANHRFLMLCVLALVILGIIVIADASLWRGTSSAPADDSSTVNLQELAANAGHLARIALFSVLVTTWVVALGLLREVRPDIGFLYGCLVAVLLLVPPFNVAILWSIDRAARKPLQEYGVDVGLMGAPRTATAPHPNREQSADRTTE